MAKNSGKSAGKKTEERPKGLRNVSTVKQEDPVTPPPVARSLRDPPAEKPKTGSVTTVTLPSSNGPVGPQPPLVVAAPSPPPAPRPVGLAGSLPEGIVGKRGHPVWGDVTILRFQSELDTGNSECWIHDDESLKSVTDPNLPVEERLKNVKLRGRRGESN